MTDRKPKPTRDQLIAMLPQSGWNHGDDPASKNRTLEELVRAAHIRQTKGEDPGIIKKVEAELEVDLIQLQELWVHLGLPI